MRRLSHPLLTWLLAGLLLLTQHGVLQHALGHAVGQASSQAQRQHGASLSPSQADAPDGTAARVAAQAEAGEPADGVCGVCMALAGLCAGLVLALPHWQAPKAGGDPALPTPSRAPPNRPRPAFAARAPPVLQH